MDIFTLAFDEEPAATLLLFVFGEHHIDSFKIAVTLMKEF
jgi:hypothetical protein